MILLVDTHAFLWYLTADPRLSAAAKILMINPAHQLFLSRASLWEIAIKVSIGKLTLPSPFPTLIPQKLQQTGTQIMEIKLEHLAAIIPLPFHHKDPFDRMLVARCIVDQIPILSADSVLDQYPIKRLW